MEWFVKAWAALDWLHRGGVLVGLIILLFSLAPAFSQSKGESKQPRAADGGSVTIRGGDGGLGGGRGGDVSIRGGDGGPNGERGGDVHVQGRDGGNVNLGDKTIIINNGALQQGGQGNKPDQQNQQPGQNPGQQQTQQPSQKPGQGQGQGERKS